MDRLRLTLYADDDWTGQLRAEVIGEGFAGSGSAWFSLDQLRTFCEGLGVYPLEPSSVPSIAGGYWHANEPRLKQTHLAVRIAPHDGRGALRVIVELAEPEDDPPDENARAVKTWFVTGYNELERFRASLLKMLDGDAAEAVLISRPQ